jgi:hypothetical protein
MNEISEELKKYVDDQFSDWDEYKTCDCSCVDIDTGDEVKQVKVNTFVNGMLKHEGEAPLLFAKSVDEAIDLTKAFFEKVKSQYKHIYIRKKPELYKNEGSEWYLYCRLALSN